MSYIITWVLSVAGLSTGFYLSDGYLDGHKVFLTALGAFGALVSHAVRTGFAEGRS